jgi:hypothetical protein
VNAVRRVLKSIYEFLCGDLAIFIATLVAFVVSGALVSIVHAPRIVAVIVFVGLTVAGLVLSLGRERNAGGN